MLQVVEGVIGEGTLTLDAGKLAGQADSAVTVRYGKRKWEYDFDKNAVTEVKEF